MHLKVGRNNVLEVVISFVKGRKKRDAGQEGQKQRVLFL